MRLRGRLSIWKDGVVFAILIVVLLVKPTGILGPSRRWKKCKEGETDYEKTRSAIRIPMPARYVINLIHRGGLVRPQFADPERRHHQLLSGILITVGINIILATSLNVATGYLGQLPLGHAGFHGRWRLTQAVSS